MKKILSVLLTLVCLFQYTAVGAKEEEKYISVLNYIGIDVSAETQNGSVSRGEFVSFVLKLFGIEPAVKNSDEFWGYFADVDENYEWYNDINTAYEKGIISGHSGEFFAPEDNITKAQAVKIILSAMNYDRYAELKGGYPFGYIQLAEELDMLDGVSATEDLTRFDAYKIIYNSLNVPLAEIKILSDGTVSYETDGELTLLKKRELDEETGVVTAVNGFCAYPIGSAASENQIEINRVAYNINIENVSVDLLGKTVKAYIDREKEEVVAIACEENKNNVYEVEFENLENKDKTGAEILEDGRSKRIKFSQTAYVLLNNSCYGTAEQAIVDGIFDDFSSVCFVDNNKDGEVDFIKITKYVYRYVEDIYSSEQIILFGNDMGRLDADEEDVIVKIYKDGMNFSAAMVRRDDVLKIMESKTMAGEKYYEIYVSGNTVTGTLKSVINDEKVYYNINGDLYELTKEYMKYLENSSDVKPSIGAEATFMLSDDGKIVFQRAGAEYSYGYLTKMYGGDEDGEFDVYISIYGLDEKIKKYEAAEKVRVYSEDYSNGQKLKKEAFYTYIKDKADYSNGLIMYNLNENNEISAFILPIEQNTAGKSDYPLCEDYSVITDTQGHPRINGVYYGVYEGKYYLTESMPIIFVPMDNAKKDNETNYSIENCGYWPNRSYDQFPIGTKIKLYNAGELYSPEVMVIENNDEVKAEVDEKTEWSIIEKIEQALNEDDEVVTKCTFYNKGVKTSAIITEETKLQINEGSAFYGTEGMTADDLKAGDIVQMTLSSNKKEILLINILFNASDKGKARVKCIDDNEYGFSPMTLCYGTVTAKGSSAIMLNAGELTSLFLTHDTKYYYLVEQEGKKTTVSAISLNDIRKGDYLAGRKNYNNACDFVVYR